MIRIVSLPEVTSSRAQACVPELAAGDWEAIRGGVITIGNFDGVHVGHAALLAEVRRHADVADCPAVAVVLDPHPASILRPDQAPKRLTWIERRAELMGRLGIDVLAVCATTPELLRMTAEEFFRWLVVDQLGAQAMVEGPNFFFGRDRGGDVKVLGQLCASSGIELKIVSPSLASDQMISSTRIRALLNEGCVEAASTLLGIPYRVRGRVVGGAGRGGTIGFPTANLSDVDVVVPAHGVYGGVAIIVSGDSRSRTDTVESRLSATEPESAVADRTTCGAAIHIGPNPTFEHDGDEKVEVHLLDFDGDLYGQTLLVDFIMRVRGVARFESAQELIQQLNDDIATIRANLKQQME